MKGSTLLVGYRSPGNVYGRPGGVRKKGCESDSDGLKKRREPDFSNKEFSKEKDCFD